MKKTICIFITIVLLAGMLCGCQKTPEAPIVVGKNQDQLIELAMDIENQGATVGEQVSAPDAIRLDFKDHTKKLKFFVDAEVSVPDAATAKIIRVTAHEITQEEVDRWTEVLFSGETLYTLDSFGQMTKRDIAEELLRAKKRLAELGEDSEGETLYVDVPANPEDPGGEVDAPVEYTEGEELRTEIKHYEEMLKTAPDEPIMTKTENKLERAEGGRFTYAQFGVPAENGSGIRAFSAANYGFSHPIIYADKGESTFSGESYIFSLEEMELSYIGAGEKYRAQLDKYRKLPAPKITKEEAVGMSSQLLSRLGIEGYAVNRAELAISESMVMNAMGEAQGNGLKGWSIEYRREIGGIGISYTDPQIMASPDSGESWSYEQITLFVTDDGVAEIYVEEQYDIGETLVENCKLMEFDTVMDIFKKMMPVQYSVSAMGGLLIEAEWRINSIEFGYTRVLDDNSDYTGLLIPTWSFYGRENIIYKSEEAETGEYAFSANMYPILTINAIDGSIIDTAKGY